MISTREAKELIMNSIRPLEKLGVPLMECTGYALDGDLYAPIDFPSFNQSAMDGYGIRIQNQTILKEYQVVGVVEAGNTDALPLIEQGEAVRIFTGAPVPKGVDTVIPQEWVIASGKKIQFKQFEIQQGINIRLKGSQTAKGEKILSGGSALRPATAAFLAGLGIDRVRVTAKPKITIINTGKELVAPGGVLKEGQIFESNSFALYQALKKMHIRPKEIIQVDDEQALLNAFFSHAINTCDIVLITGGVSVGDYDFVVDALEKNAVIKTFHQIRQKPGKPLYFGKKNEKIIFGLPGNPASVVTCFYQYVVPAIKKLMGFADVDLQHCLLPCLSAYEKKSGMTHFLKGKLHPEGVEILPHQESYKMNTFAIADILIEVEEECTRISIYDKVKTYFLNSL